MDFHYKAHPDCDHVAKFHGDRPRELGDLVAKQIKKEKKTSAVKHKAGTTVPGGLIKPPGSDGFMMMIITMD